MPKHIQNKEFWIKILFFKKKKKEISFEIKLLPKVVCLGHVCDNLANAAVLNSGFIIFEFNYRCYGQRLHHF